MANKRDFKKYIDAVSAMVTEEMLYAYVNVENADKKAISEAIGMVMDAAENARNHANIYFDKGHKAFESLSEYGKEKSAFFQKLFNKINTEYSANIDAALAKFNAALPQEIKDGLKASAQ